MNRVESNLHTPNLYIPRRTFIFHAKNCITCGIYARKYGTVVATTTTTTTTTTATTTTIITTPAVMSSVCVEGVGEGEGSWSSGEESSSESRTSDVWQSRQHV